MEPQEQGSQHRSHLTYLVRLWRTDPEEPWRASARDVHAGDEQNFGTLDALFAYLGRQAGSSPAGQE